MLKVGSRAFHIHIIDAIDVGSRYRVIIVSTVAMTAHQNRDKGCQERKYSKVSDTRQSRWTTVRITESELLEIYY